ncbi:MAG: hypothetical protein V2J24_08135 [Pseudomonadales bacterium]|jgi:hypothetical protein|nr:hypothetical protein [Pseudomonadales bacterium]
MATKQNDPGPRFRSLIELNRTLQERQEADAELDRRVRVLQAWQCERLLDTHDDLARHPRYGPGVDFFVQDLYAPKDFSDRDSDIERAVPAMVRLLPEGVLHTAADGAGLYVLSRELDHAMTNALFDEIGVEEIDADAYAEAYRICDDHARRVEQIELVAALAARLDRFVRSRFIYATLKMTRTPARLAGLGELQDFLERGFSAFHHMQGSADFAQTIVERERLILDRIFDRHPEPFSV